MYIYVNKISERQNWVILVDFGEGIWVVRLKWNEGETFLLLLLVPVIYSVTELVNVMGKEMNNGDLDVDNMLNSKRSLRV